MRFSMFAGLSAFFIDAPAPALATTKPGGEKTKSPIV